MPKNVKHDSSLQKWHFLGRKARPGEHLNDQENGLVSLVRQWMKSATRKGFCKNVNLNVSRSGSLLGPPEGGNMGL